MDIINIHNSQLTDMPSLPTWLYQKHFLSAMSYVIIVVLTEHGRMVVQHFGDFGK